MNNEHTTEPKQDVLLQSPHTNGSLPWMDKSLSPRERAGKLVATMTLEQKIAQLHGAMETINIYALPSADEMNAMSPEDKSGSWPKFKYSAM